MGGDRQVEDQDAQVQQDRAAEVMAVLLLLWREWARGYPELEDLLRVTIHQEDGKEATVRLASATDRALERWGELRPDLRADRHFRPPGSTQEEKTDG